MRTVSDYFEEVFHAKVRKIAVNAGLGCPNRDGRLGTRGCAYCNNEAFTPSYAFGASGSITRQLEEGIRFSSIKGDTWGYLAYFQSFSNTYGPTEKLIRIYEEALSYPGIKGLVLATRPDCLAPDLLDYFEKRFGRLAPEGHPHLLIEIGVESTKDETLALIGRGHDFNCVRNAVIELARRGIDCGAHVILGLPGEDIDDYISHAEKLSSLPLKTVKLHQLQIIKGTVLADRYIKAPGSLKLFTPEEYAVAVKAFLSGLDPGIAIDRLVSETPQHLLIAPRWGMKPAQFAELLKKTDYICKNNTQ